MRVFICDYLRTPIGRFGGALSSVRADDLAAIPIRGLVERRPEIAHAIDEVYLGCANQAGEDNRNVARMAALLAGLPVTVPAVTFNRLCASGMDAVITAYRAIRSGEAQVIVAGGVESMSRAPFVMPKADTGFSRKAQIFDTTIGWRFVNKLMEAEYGIDSMPETAENVAQAYGVSREDQDRFALTSQDRAAEAQKSGRLAREILPVSIPLRNRDTILVDQDEHPRQTSLDKLASLPTPFRDGGCVTAGNSSGVNDGAAALIIASERAVASLQLTPLAEITGAASAGVEPRLMGIGPVPAISKLCEMRQTTPDTFDIIELNEAFASQALACLRELKLAPFSGHINPNGGAIALGHPLGMTGARLVGTAAIELSETAKSSALCSMCVGVGQGVAVSLARP